MQVLIPKHHVLPKHRKTQYEVNHNVCEPLKKQFFCKDFYIMEGE